MNSEERQAIVNVVKDREPDNEASQSVVLDESNMMIISDVRGHEKGAPGGSQGNWWTPCPPPPGPGVSAHPPGLRRSSLWSSGVWSAASCST